jgi:hypothetical protein
MSDTMMRPSTTTTRPSTTTTRQPDPLRAWIRRVIMPDLPLIPNPTPNPAPDLSGRALPPLPDPGAGYRTAYDDAKPTIYRAMSVSASTPEVQRARQDLSDRVDAMTALATNRKYPQALNALPGVVTAARKVIALGDVAGVKAKQLGVQQGQYEEMKGVCDEVVRTYFNPNAASSSGRVRKEKLNPGKHFKAYLTALETVETTRGKLPKKGPIPPSDVTAAKQDCDALMAAAQDYLTHFEQDLSDREKRDKTNQRKFQIVTEGLKAARQFSLAMEVQEIGAPTAQQPWDRETEARAGGLRAAVNFETGYKKGSDLSDTGGGGASSAFWVESKPPGAKKATKNFIFKPMQGERTPAKDDRPGAGAAKEALASANAKLFERQTGIDLGVPETQVTSIGSYALDLKGDEANGQPRVGSLQEFAPSDGPLGTAGVGARRKISAKQCQKIAISDIMGLNFDRHSGNLLLDGSKDPNAPDLVPIDHGCTLPTRKDFAAMANRIGGISISRDGVVKAQNAVLGIPAAFEKFDDDTIAKLDLLDPDAMVQGMRDQLLALDTVNPGLDSQNKVPDESLAMSKRSMIVMKAASRDLSPAEIQIAIGQHGEELFDADDAHFDGIAARIIADMKAKSAGYTEIFTSSSGRLDEIVKTLQTNGWAPDHGDLAAWIMADPVGALKLYKSGAVNANAQNDADGNPLASTKQVSDALAALSDTQVLRKSIGTLTAKTIDNLNGVPGTAARALDRARAEIKDLLTNGDVVGAEAKARQVEADSLELALGVIRTEADTLYTRRDPLFADMGTDEQELAKREKIKNADAKQLIVRRIANRRDSAKHYSDIVAVTGINADLAAARIALPKLRRTLTPIT